jgi:hypothetical protein
MKSVEIGSKEMNTRSMEKALSHCHRGRASAASHHERTDARSGLGGFSVRPELL